MRGAAAATRSARDLSGQLAASLKNRAKRPPDGATSAAALAAACGEELPNPGLQVVDGGVERTAGHLDQVLGTHVAYLPSLFSSRSCPMESRKQMIQK